MKKIFILFCLICITIQSLQAQGLNELWLYNENNAERTARSAALGNVNGSMGSDFGSLSINPAGIGFYRSNEMVFTPSFSLGSSQGTYLGQDLSNKYSKFQVNNLGFVVASIKYQNTTNKKGESVKKEKGQLSFGIGMNKNTDYKHITKATGFNNSHSFASALVSPLNDGAGTSINDLYNQYPFTGYLAYQGYIADPFFIGDSTYYSTPLAGGNMQQYFQTQDKGSNNEVVLSVGGNHKNKLYVGGTVSFNVARYTSRIIRTEIDEKNLVNGIDQFSFVEDLDAVVSGIGLKLGSIYRVNNYLRVGAAIHTPKILNIDEIYNTSLNSTTDVAGEVFVESPVTNEFSYKIATPWVGVLSTTFILPKYGLLSIDYEGFNQASSSISFDNEQNINYETEINNDAKEFYTRVHKLRFGLEAMVKKIALRVGGNVNTSPIKSDYKYQGYNWQSNSISAGLGYRAEGYFADFALVNTLQKNYKFYYVASNADTPVLLKNNRLKLILTLGLRF